MHPRPEFAAAPQSRRHAIEHGADSDARLRTHSPPDRASVTSRRSPPDAEPPPEDRNRLNLRDSAAGRKLAAGLQRSRCRDPKPFEVTDEESGSNFLE
jgi:hypothetical protein